MILFKDYSIDDTMVEYRGGWRHTVKFFLYHAPKIVTTYEIQAWCHEHFGARQIDQWLEEDTTKLWALEHERWFFFKHDWQLVEFKVRWFADYS